MHILHTFDRNWRAIRRTIARGIAVYDAGWYNIGEMENRREK